MTGEKRVVRVRVTNMRELLQRMPLLPEAIGEGLAKGPAKRWPGIGWERRQCARGADLGDQRNRRAPARRGSRSPAARFGDKRVHISTNNLVHPQQFTPLSLSPTLPPPTIN